MCACRGPHENYADRKSSAHRRLYQALVADMSTPYIAPSENGGREDTRWLALTPDADAMAPGASGVAYTHTHTPGVLVAAAPHPQAAAAGTRARSVCSF